MSAMQDVLQDGREIAHIGKLFKVIEAVQEAFNDGVDPRRIQKAILMFLSQKQPLSTSQDQGLRINQPDQDLINVAAASATTGCLNADSLMRGLPYHHSAQDLTNEFLAAAGQAKVKCQDERKQRANEVPAPGAAKLAYEERGFVPFNGATSIQEGKDDAMIALNGTFDQVTCGQTQPKNAFIFNNFLRTRSKSAGNDEWVTLDNAPSLRAPKEDEQKLEEQEKEDDFDSTIVAPQLTHIKDFAYKDNVVDQLEPEEEVVSKPSRPKTVLGTKKPAAVDKETDKKSTKKKAILDTKKTAATAKRQAAFDSNTTAPSHAQASPVKRRGGRPVGYRKQANGKFAFSDGSTQKGKGQSSSNGGDKKRKASADDIAIGSSNNKRQRKGKDKGSKAAEVEKIVVEKKDKSSKVKRGQA